MTDCPCCGQPLPENPPKVDLGLNIMVHGPSWIQLTPMEAVITHILLQHTPSPVVKEKLLYAIYGGADGPDDAEGCLRVQVYRLRKKLIGAGVFIDNIHGRGYRIHT